MDRGIFGSYFSRKDPGFRRAVELYERLPKEERDYIDVAELLVEAARGMPAKGGVAALLRRAHQVSAAPAWRDRLRPGRMYWWLDRPSAELMVRPKTNPFVADQAPAEGAPPAPAGLPRTPLGILLHRRFPTLRKVLARLAAMPAPLLPGWSFQSVSEEARDGSYGIETSWQAGPDTLIVRILPADQKGAPSLCRSSRIKLTYIGPAEMPPEHLQGLRQLCAVLDRCLQPARDPSA
jgi:hypothetical protein